MTVIFKGTTIVDNSNLYSRVDRYVTVPIAKETAPYLRLSSRRGPTTGYEGFITPLNNGAVNYVQSALAIGGGNLISLVNASYDRLVSRLAETAQVGANIAEGKSTLAMVKKAKDASRKGLYDGFMSIGKSLDKIVLSSTRIRKAIVALRNGRLDHFCAVLKVPKRKQDPSIFKPSDRTVSALWLSYWFGVAPLVQDVMTSLDVLTRPLPKGRVRGSANDYVSQFGTSPAYWYRELTAQTGVRQGVTVQVHNPNEFLRQSLGLANFWSVGWEVIPFSFLADWVSNVSQVLGAMSDFDGMTVTQSFTSATCKARSRDIMVDPALPCDASFTAVQMRRTVGMTKPIFKIDLPRRLSVTRAATAVSLLLVLFT